MAHTPGPWTVEETERQAGRGGGLRIVNSDRGYVASLLSYENRRFSEEREADARLIAAAPELLAALIQARDFYRNAGSADNFGAGFDIDTVCAAIAKAEGR